MHCRGAAALAATQQVLSLPSMHGLQLYSYRTEPRRKQIFIALDKVLAPASVLVLHQQQNCSAAMRHSQAVSSDVACMRCSVNLCISCCLPCQAHKTLCDRTCSWVIDMARPILKTWKHFKTLCQSNSKPLWGLRLMTLTLRRPHQCGAPSQ